MQNKFKYEISFPHATAFESDSRYLSAEEQNRELTRSISREVGKLSEQWNNLIDHSDNWKHSLDEYMTVSFTFATNISFRYLYFEFASHFTLLNTYIFNYIIIIIAHTHVAPVYCLHQ